METRWKPSTGLPMDVVERTMVIVVPVEQRLRTSVKYLVRKI